MLQFIPTSIVVWVATIITVATGTYCAQSKSVHFAHVWISTLKVIITTVALLGVLRFYKFMKHHLQPHGMLLKFVAFKSIIGLNVL